MRVGLDGFPLAVKKTGVGHYTYELARALARIAPEDQFELVSPSTSSPSDTTEIELPSNLRRVSVRTNSITRRWFAVGLPRYFRKASLDLFHGTNYEVPLWNKRRNVITIHDLSVLSHPETHESRIGRRARRRLPIMARASAAIITPTHSVKQEVTERLSINPEKVVAIPEAAREVFRPMSSDETAETRKRLGIEDDFILFVGTIEPRKNLTTLVRAFARLTRESPHLPQLVIAGGEGWLMDEFTDLIRGLRISDRLRMTGYLNDDDLRALYSSCKVFVYPSLYEGFGLPPLEAMACGAPVIASRIPALMETFKDAALFFDPTDEEALAKTLTVLLENENERAELAARGLQHSRKFSWEKTARLTLAVYRDVLGEI